MNIIITGCSKGIGYELVKMMSCENKVFAVSRNIHPIEKLKSNSDYSDNIIPLSFDVAQLKQSQFDQLISENKIRKGNVLEVANIAGIQAAKKTHELIPLCHSLSLSYVKIQFEISKNKNLIEITSEACSVGKTGVEMEALTAVSVAALTIYDMCKSLDKEITITDIKLKHKSGGKSGIFNA